MMDKYLRHVSKRLQKRMKHPRPVVTEIMLPYEEPKNIHEIVANHIYAAHQAFPKIEGKGTNHKLEEIVTKKLLNDFGPTVIDRMHMKHKNPMREMIKYRTIDNIKTMGGGKKDIDILKTLLKDKKIKKIIDKPLKKELGFFANLRDRTYEILNYVHTSGLLRRLGYAAATTIGLSLAGYLLWHFRLNRRQLISMLPESLRGPATSLGNTIVQTAVPFVAGQPPIGQSVLAGQPPVLPSQVTEQQSVPVVESDTLPTISDPTPQMINFGGPSLSTVTTETETTAPPTTEVPIESGIDFEDTMLLGASSSTYGGPPPTTPTRLTQGTTPVGVYSEEKRKGEEEKTHYVQGKLLKTSELGKPTISIATTTQKFGRTRQRKQKTKELPHDDIFEMMQRKSVEEAKQRAILNIQNVYRAHIEREKQKKGEGLQDTTEQTKWGGKPKHLVNSDEIRKQKISWYMIDELNQYPKERTKSVNILNLDNSSGGGTHWTLFIVSKDNGKMYYVDPFSPKISETPKNIRRLAKILGLKLVENQNQIQHIDSNMCGYIALFLAKKFRKILKNKGLLDDKDFNNTIIKEFTRHPNDAKMQKVLNWARKNKIVRT